jgi:hypothetical protein
MADVENVRLENHHNGRQLVLCSQLKAQLLNNLISRGLTTDLWLNELNYVIMFAL